MRLNEWLKRISPERMAMLEMDISCCLRRRAFAGLHQAEKGKKAKTAALGI